MEIRSFLAFELPSEIKGIVEEVSGELRKSALEVRWVKAGNIHLTVVSKWLPGQIQLISPCSVFPAV